MSRETVRRTFSAMGTTIEVTGVGISPSEADRGLLAGKRLAEAWERSFSRFRPDSELSRLNAAGGQSITVSERFLALLSRALRARAATGGRFDPFALPALLAAGYDRDFEHLRSQPDPPAVAPPPADLPAQIVVDRVAHTVRLGPGTLLDLGGIAKGAFADRLAAKLTTWPGGCVDAGGDLRFWGVPPDGRWWRVGVEDARSPGAGSLIVEVSLPSAAVATSSTLRRRWPTPAGEAHHLIDPATRKPAAGSAYSATAIAPTAAEAEVATKSLIVSAARAEEPAPGPCYAGAVFREGRSPLYVAGHDPSVCLFIEEDADAVAS
jgi:thiamine biosynthesis lipoprotein